VRWGAALVLGLAAAAATLLDDAALLEAWLVGFLAWGGLSVGALGALAIGHLLREDWLAPVRAPLEAAALAMPLVAVMALPVLAGVEALYVWAGPVPPPMPAPRAAWYQPWPFRLRGLGVLAAWIVLAWLLTRPGGPGKRVSAVALAVLALSVMIAAQDWVLSRDPSWWGSLQGFAIWLESAMTALAAAALVSLARGAMPPGETGAGEALERALLALGLATLWLWFTQFVVVWMADLPEEAAWYGRRLDPPWNLVKLGVAVPLLLLALVLAAPPRHQRWRMAAVCMLLMASHLAHLWWTVRPDAPRAMPAAWLDGAVLAFLGLCWAAWWRRGLRRPVSPGRAASGRGPAPAMASGR
jgi:hypothetical protein